MKRALALLLVTCICLSFFGCGGASKYVETQKRAYFGEITVEGNAVIPAQDGTSTKISGDIYSTQITMDRAHIVTLEKDGTLSVSDSQGKKKIADDIRSINSAGNEIILYSRMENSGVFYGPNEYGYEDSSLCEYTYERYTYSNGKMYSLGNVMSYKVSQNGGSILYTVDKSYQNKNRIENKYELHLLLASEEASEVVITSKNVLTPVGVNKDGSVYAWIEGTDENQVVYIYSNGERQKAFTFPLETGYSKYLQFNTAEDFAVLTVEDVDTMAIWTADSGVTKVKLPAGAVGGVVYTDTGLLSNYPDVKAGAVYVQTYDELNKKNLYSVNLDGTREKIASRVVDCEIRQGVLYTISDDYVLYSATVANGVMSNDTKISGDVCDFSLSPDGKAVVYARDVAEDRIGSLYYFALGMEKAVRIASEAYCYAYYGSWSGYWSYSLTAKFSNDGSTVYYFVDTDPIMDSYSYSGTLMQYNIEKDESIRIGSDILPSISSEYVGNFPESKGIWYYKFSSYDDEYGVLCDYMFWNGESATTLANDVIY